MKISHYEWLRVIYNPNDTDYSRVVALSKKLRYQPTLGTFEETKLGVLIRFDTEEFLIPRETPGFKGVVSEIRFRSEHEPERVDPLQLATFIADHQINSKNAPKNLYAITFSGNLYKPL